MNILLCSVPFRPSVGGIETVSSILAEEFALRGHEVTVVTLTRSATQNRGAQPYAVVRAPSPRQLWLLVSEADVVLHNNISLKLAWPLLLCRRPWVVAHHTWTPRDGIGRVKRWLLRFAHNVSVSEAMAASLPLRSVVVPNPYRAAEFRAVAGVERSRDVLFVGRLVSDKGIDVLLRALRILSDRGLRLSATIVGDGPERDALEHRAAQAGIADQIAFLGSRQGAALVTTMCAHRFLVVPSTWEEPFGVVVLEALACGCVPVVAASGGLPDAAGPCGVIFPKGDSAALAAHLAALGQEPGGWRPRQHLVAEHLSKHRPGQVADAYLQVLQDACRRDRNAFVS